MAASHRIMGPSLAEPMDKPNFKGLILTEEEATRYVLTVCYYSGVATVGNVWRSVGIKRKAYNTAEALWYGTTVAMEFFMRLPSRCLRGRSCARFV